MKSMVKSIKSMVAKITCHIDVPSPLTLGKGSMQNGPAHIPCTFFLYLASPYCTLLQPFTKDHRKNDHYHDYHNHENSNNNHHGNNKIYVNIKDNLAKQ